MRTLPFSILCCAFLSFVPPAVYGQSKPQWTIAILIDDLPAGGANRMSSDELIALTSKLLATLKAKNVPAVGFVNERKLYRSGEADARIKTLSLWLDNGFGWEIIPLGTLP